MDTVNKPTADDIKLAIANSGKWPQMLDDGWLCWCCALYEPTAATRPPVIRSCRCGAATRTKRSRASFAQVPTPTPCTCCTCRSASPIARFCWQCRSVWNAGSARSCKPWAGPYVVCARCGGRKGSSSRRHSATTRHGDGASCGGQHN
jgi:hypothetical protein